MIIHIGTLSKNGVYALLGYDYKKKNENLLLKYTTTNNMYAE